MVLLAPAFQGDLTLFLQVPVLSRGLDLAVQLIVQPNH